MRIAEDFLQGKGIEIGRGGHNPLAPDDCIAIAPCDGKSYMDPRDLEDYRNCASEQERHNGKVAKVDFVSEADSLPFIESNSLDYVATSHVLEHIPDIFTAWNEWWRVLKPGGINFMIVPKRLALEDDIARAVTALDDHVKAFSHAVKPQDLPDMAWRGHYHVFTLQSLLDALNWYNQQGLGCWLLVAQEETDTKVGNGHTLVLKKVAELPNLHEAIPQLAQCYAGQKFPEAKEKAQQVLSLNFRIPEAWFVLAMAELQANDVTAALQALTQALVLQPRNKDYNEAYQQIAGKAFAYPFSLVDYFSRMI